MNEAGFGELVDAIIALGTVDEERAAEYASLIGDTPLIVNGEVVVMDGEREVARLRGLAGFWE